VGGGGGDSSAKGAMEKRYLAEDAWQNGGVGLLGMHHM